MIELKNLKDFYLKEIKETLNFWQNHSFDEINGGFCTYLTETGEIFGNEKSVWAQGRGLYIFSLAYNTIEKNKEWLEVAKKTYLFMKNHCFDEDGRMYFIVTKDGTGFQKRRYYFSETFMVIGALELYKATGDKEQLEFGLKVYDNLMKLYDGTIKSEPKFNPEVFSSISLASPMILLSTTQIIRENTCETEQDEEKYNQKIAEYFKEIKLHKRDFNGNYILLENVAPNGTSIDGPKGRVINPGHSIEASWFLMKEYLKNNNQEYLDFALKVLNGSFEKGWDKECGGLYSFMDELDYPREQLEWDMKMWWPHTECLIAFLLAYKITKDQKYLNYYNMVHEYSFNKFKDHINGEWFGYLHRDGSIANTCKGNLFKGPFHIPRCLILNYNLLNTL